VCWTWSPGPRTTLLWQDADAGYSTAVAGSAQPAALKQWLTTGRRPDVVVWTNLDDLLGGGP
jgi:hypothetical protein